MIKCLYEASFFEEALQQVQNAIKTTDNKPILFFYKSAVLFALGRTKEALLQLQTGMEASPKMIKQLIELEPSLLQHSQVIELLAKNKNNK